MRKHLTDADNGANLSTSIALMRVCVCVCVCVGGGIFCKAYVSVRYLKWQSRGLSSRMQHSSADKISRRSGT